MTGVQTCALPIWATNHCSFCGKPEHEVLWLVSGWAVFICNECNEAAREAGARIVVENAVRAAAKRG